MPASNAVLPTIPVGMEPTWIAIAPDGKRAYVTMSDHVDGSAKGAVAVIDTQSKTLLTTIAVGILPSNVVVAPEGRRAYVPNIAHGGVVSVIDTAANAVVDSITVSPPGSRPQGVALTPDGRHLYLAIEGLGDDPAGGLSVIDLEEKAVIANMPLLPCEAAAAITPDGHSVYMLHLMGPGPAVVDTTTHELTFPLTSAIACGSMGFTPDGSLFYLFADDFGEVFDLATHKLVTVFDTFGGHTTGVAVSADGRHVYVSQRPGKSAGGILVIDVPTQKRVDPPIERTVGAVTAGVVASRIELPGSADGLALLPDGVTAYVSDRHARAVRIISLPS